MKIRLIRKAVLPSLALLAPCGAAPAWAQGSGTGSSAAGTAAVQVVRPLTAQTLADLDFGLVASDAKGSVTIAAGSVSARFAGAARNACGDTGSCPAAHPARFAVTGESSRSYRIAVPERLTLTGAGPGGGVSSAIIVAMTVKTASRPASGPEGMLDKAGRDTFEMGGTLELPSEQQPARYIVHVPVIVTYS